MKQRFFRRIAAFSLTASLIATPILTTPAFAQDKSNQNQSKSNLKPLDAKNDPTLIGKRDINKGNLSLYSLDREVALGRQLSAEVDRSTKLIDDPVVTEYVNRIAQNIVLHSDAKVPFTIKVIDANEVNAFALPGGFLYVNRGLLEAAENEAEVAGVMAHEIAHVAARHGIEQASKGEIMQWGSIPLIFLGGLGGFIIQQVAGLAIPLTFLKFSRGAEKEADRLGAQYMWASGYDPNALVSFFEKLQAQEKRKPGTLEKVFSTHPMTGDRIKEVRELIPRFPDRGEYQISTSEFREVRARLISVSGATRSSGSRDDGRPTLKRRPQSQSDDASGSSGGDSDTPNRPVLKRRDSSGDVDINNDEPSSSNGRPVLKRREASTDPDADKPEASSENTGRPVLKRREGSSDTDPSAAPAKQESTKPADSTGSTGKSESNSDGRPVLKKKTDANGSTGEKTSDTGSKTPNNWPIKPPGN
ncbi:MAG TPA: M48 family metalloprotease [Blastocatellia bacterium]|nr:M48 family metalloprotease [Blastocatellia bacterium]HMV85626.1 M48 family metalloprotease [Blastocatellia bacterium]HMY71712.1 M48 family metalloprotease [Blastocatellia bacterium]HNG29735.1 M48 family metalloprotease [Blastocatellia bacterium]